MKSSLSAFAPSRQINPSPRFFLGKVADVHGLREKITVAMIREISNRNFKEKFRRETSNKNFEDKFGRVISMRSFARVARAAM